MRACLLPILALLVIALTLPAQPPTQKADDKKPDPKKTDDKKPDEKKPADKAEPKPPPFLTVDKLASKYKELVPALINSLRDPDPSVRQTAAYTLGTLGKDALPLLIAATSNPDREVRANAAQVLGQLGNQAQDAIPALLALMKDPDPEVRVRASYAMSRIVGDSVPPPAPPGINPLPLGVPALAPMPMPPATPAPKGAQAAPPPGGVVPARYVVPAPPVSDPGVLLQRAEPRPLPTETIPRTR